MRVPRSWIRKDGSRVVGWTEERIVHAARARKLRKLGRDVRFYDIQHGHARYRWVMRKAIGVLGGVTT